MLLLSGDPIRDHARLEARRGRRTRPAQDPARLSTGADPFLSLDPRPRLSPRRRPIPRTRAPDDRAQDGGPRGIFPVPPRGLGYSTSSGSRGADSTGRSSNAKESLSPSG